MTVRETDSKHRVDNGEMSDPVGEVLARAARQIEDDQEKSWRLYLHAPRWSVGKGRTHSERSAVGLYLLAGLLALAGVVLAIHFLDRFLPGPTAASTATSAAPLTVQIGSWAVV